MTSNLYCSSLILKGFRFQFRPFCSRTYWNRYLVSGYHRCLPNFRNSSSAEIVKNQCPRTSVFAREMSSSDEARAILDKVPEVVIDAPGKVFKYILIELNLGGESKKFVRGFEHCYYHGDIMDEFMMMSEKLHPRMKSKCLGGGRIDHQSDKILIYGYSQGFGRANHETSSKLVRTAFPDKAVEWNNDGY